MMDLVGTTELPDIGKLQFYKVACADSWRRDDEQLGLVELTCVKPFFLRGIWVKFTGFNTLYSDDGRGDILQKVDLLAAEEDYYLGGIHEVLLGFGEEDENESTTIDGGPLLQLGVGTHKWNFAFKIPTNAPFSYCDKSVEVLYTIKVILDSPQVPVAISQISHVIIVGCRGENFSFHKAVPADQIVESSTTPQPLSVLGSNQNETFSIMRRPGLFQILRNALGANESAVTIMRLTLPGGVGNSSIPFEFAYLRRVLSVRCSLETDLLGKEMKIQANLLTCVNLRRDPKKPFQSIRSLVASEASTIKSTLKKDGMVESNNNMNGGYCNSIWSKSVSLKSPQKQNIVNFDIPIVIDPSARKVCLNEWPHATALPNESRDCILNFTAEGPLFEYKVVLVVSVYREKRGNQRLLFPSCMGEILVRPPIHAPVFTMPLARRRVTLAAPASILRLNAADSYQSFAIDPVPSRAFGVRNRGRNTFQTPRVPGPPTSRVDVHSDSATGHFTMLNPGIAARQDRHDRAVAPIVSRAAIISSLMEDENTSPNLENSRRSTTSPHNRSTVHTQKSVTPHAVKSVPKVMAEAMSRGPAAVLQDRTNAQHRDVQITPSRFALAYEVGIGAVVICDTSTDITPTGTSAGGRVREAMFEASPATAFLCSPHTVRLMNQQDDSPLSSVAVVDTNERGTLNSLAVEPNVRRLSFSPSSRLSSDTASVVTEDICYNLFDAYTYSPPPVVLTSRSHSLSASSIRPIALYM